MSSLYLLIPMSITFIIIAAVVMIMAIKRGQFDDLDRYEKRMPDDF